MRIKRFEDIQSWQEARSLNRVIYALSKKGEFCKDFALQNQIQRASISIMANIAEGFDRQSKREFIQYLTYSSASASEVQSHLYAALDLGYINEKEFRDMYEKTKLVKNLINGFIKYLKNNL